MPANPSALDAALVTERGIALLEAQPRHWRMTLDEEVVVCPGCRASLYERGIGKHAVHCDRLRAMATILLTPTLTLHQEAR